MVGAKRGHLAPNGLRSPGGKNPRYRRRFVGHATMLASPYAELSNDWKQAKTFFREAVYRCLAVRRMIALCQNAVGD